MRTIFFLLLFVTSFTAFSQEGAEAPCGMAYDTDGSLIVAPANGDICEDDITYQMLYIMYEDILTHPLWSMLTSQFIHEEMKNSEFVTFASNTLGISDQIFTIMKGISALGYLFIVPIFLYKSGKILVSLSQTGELSFTEQDSDPVKLFAYAGFLIVLSLPVGGIMLGQGLSIAGSIPSLYGSNYILSGYLSTTQLGESDVQVSDESLMVGSQVFANNVVGMQLCQNRTAKALFAVNAKSGTDFFYDTTFANFTGLNTDEDDINENVNGCLSYHYDHRELGITNAVSGIELLKKDRYGITCPADRYYMYKEELYGYQHKCGSVDYNYPTNIEDMNNWGIEDELVSIQNDFSTKKMFGRFESPNRNDITNIINYRDLTPLERKVELESLYKKFADETIIPALMDSTLLNEPDRERLSTKYIFAMNAMLGGVDVNELSIFGMVGNAFGSRGEKDLNHILAPEDGSDNEPHYGFTYIADYARYAADEMEQYHCAKNWEKYTELRQFIVEYNFEEDKDTSALLTNKIHNMECVRFVAEHLSVDSDFSRYLDYTARWSDAEIFADLEVDQTGNTVKVNQLTPEELIANKEVLFELVAEVKYQEALVRKTVIEGYYYAVKYAISESLSRRLKQEASNDDMYLVARQMGAGNLGGILMALSQKQSGGVYYKNLIEGGALTSLNVDEEYFVNFDSFGDNSAGASKVEVVRETFIPMSKESFFSVGLSGKADIYQASNLDEEAEAFSTFMGSIENLFFEPVIHIKKASGIPDNISLKEGLDNCLAGQNEQCLSSTVHPIVALSRFGHHLMDNMLTMAAVGTITIMANDAIEVAMGGEIEEGKKKKKGNFEKMLGTIKKIAGTVGKGLFAVVFVILAIAAAVFKILMPFIWGLFIVGAFFSYILPLMGYIYSMSMYILWIVGLSLGGLVLPFYIAIKMFTIEDSYKRGFVEFYETFLNPYVKPLFITIAVIFSWTFAAISLFAVNSIFALLYDGLSTMEAGVLTTIIFKLLLYMVYFVTIFVMFLTSIKIIKNMPDMMATKMKLKGTNDDQFIESMSFENYVQAGIMRQVAAMPQSTLQSMTKAQEEKKQDKVLRENLTMMKEFVDGDGGSNQGGGGNRGASEGDSGGERGAPERGAGRGRGASE